MEENVSNSAPPNSTEVAGTTAMERPTIDLGQVILNIDKSIGVMSDLLIRCCGAEV